MDRRERLGDPEETMRIAMDAQQGKVWTALPGIVQSFDAQRIIANVQPTITAVVKQESGIFQPVRLPLLLDCPVVFPSGGGVSLTFPLHEGDEVLVIFASRCIDAWWQLGGVQNPVELRMHDLSDGFCVPGVRSQPRKYTEETAISLSAATLRSDDGSTFIALNPTTQGVTVTAPGGLVINANVQVNGSVTTTGDVTANGISLDHHKHGNVQSGDSQTGEPV